MADNTYHFSLFEQVQAKEALFRMKDYPFAREHMQLIFEKQGFLPRIIHNQQTVCRQLQVCYKIVLPVRYTFVISCGIF